MTDTPAARLNAHANRFEIETPQGKAVLTFAISGNTMDLQHTSVPPAQQGGGYGSALAESALAYARQNQLKVIPTCEFVRAFMESHAEYDELRGGAT